MKILTGFTIGIVLVFSNLVYAADSREAKKYAALIFAQDYQQELIAKGYKVEKNSSKEEEKIERLEDGVSHFELGPEIYHFRYEEPGVMKDKGMMYGLTSAYSWHDNFMLKAEGRIAGGQVDYESEDTGTVNGIPDFSAEVRGLGGYDFKPSQDFILTPYFGIGYRYLNDDASGKVSSTNYGGYERESNYIYSPLGVEGIFKMQDGWSIGGLVEYDIFWQGKQKSHLSDVPGYVDVTNKQKKGYGLRESVKLKKEGEELDLVIEPFIRYWSIKKSDEKSGGNEPKNNSTEIGVKFVVRF